MGANRIETQVNGELYHRDLARADNALPSFKHDNKGIEIATGLNHSNYAAASPARRPPFTRQRSSGGQPKGSAGYFKSPSERKALNFIEQLAGFELTPGETFILGSLVVLASPMLAVGMLAGCGDGEIVGGREKDGGSGPCTRYEECTPPQICISGICDVYRCEEHENCPEQTYCQIEEGQEEGKCVRTPPQEVCNGIDDDRDGMTDEKEGSTRGDFIPLDRTTGGGVGECRPLREICINGEWIPTEERIREDKDTGEISCDGLDNDCDGLIDEGLNCNPPVLDEIGNKVVDEGEELRFTINATDPDEETDAGATLTYSASDLPQGASFDPATQTFAWTPTYNQSGIYPVHFEVSDGTHTDSEEIAITVNNVNQQCVIDPIPNQSVDENQPLTVNVNASDPDREDTLTFSGENLPAGAAVDPTTGTLTWTPTFDQAGVYSNVGITVTDGDLSVTQRFYITVTNTNRTPAMDPIPSQTVNENQLLTVIPNASDPDGEALSFSGVNLPVGAAVDPRTGTLVWTPSLEQAGVYPNVGITASDGDLSVTQRFSIAVNDVNRAPVMDPIPDQTVNENQLLTVPVSASDPDGDSLTFSGENLPAGAAVDPTTGTLTWAPTFDQAGVYSNVGITVTDGDLSVTQRFYITVTNTNRTPAMDPIPSQTVNENQLLTVIPNASDPDGEALSFSGVNLPVGAAVDPRTGTLVWTPSLEQAGVYPNVGITASDGDLSVTQRFSIAVNDVNRAPVMDPIPDQTVNENQLLTINVRASDPDGDVLTFSGENLPSGSTVDPTTGTLSWTPTFAQAGVYPNVGITATDGDLSVTQRFSVTVNDVNRPPAFDSIGDKVVREGEELAFTVAAVDPDGAVLTYSATNLPAGASFDPATRTFRWTPTFEQAGVYPNIRFEVTDGELTTVEEITITVNNANRAPVLNPIGNKSVNEGELLEFSISAADPDGDALIYSATNLPAGASFDPATQTLNWTPAFEQAGIYSNVRFRVTDGDLSASEEITITVSDINRAPVFDPIGDKIVNENEELNFTVLASDPDGDALTYSATNLPPGAAFDPVLRAFRWTPTFEQAGVYPGVRFVVTDGRLLTSEEITITVNNVNLPPTMDPILDQTVNENQLLTVTPNASDPDGQALTFGGENLPGGASVDPATGVFTWRPTFAQAGTYSNVGITATDGDLSVTQRFDITVANTNQAPVMDPIPSQTIDENQLLTVVPNASDPDGDSLTFSGENLPAGAAVDPTTGTLRWTPTFDQAGAYPNVGIIATDGDLSVTQRFSITVNDVNRAPTLDPIPNQTVNENRLLTVPVSASDPDGDSLTFSGENLPAGAAVDPTTGTLSWTPTFAQAGVYSNVGITATDVDLSVTQRFSITVNNVNRAPTLDPIVNRVAEVEALLTLTISGSDPDGDTLAYSAVGLPVGANLDANTGQFSWTPTRAQVGNHEITFVISDGDLTDSEIVNIEVRGVREIRESRITNDAADSWHPSLVWTGSEYGVSWQDKRDGNPEIYFARIDAEGNKIGSDVRITNDAAYSKSPSLVWTGGEYGVSWYDDRDGSGEIYFARIDASGNKIGGDARITDAAGSSYSPSLVWTGTEYGVSWYDYRDGNYEIYFARIDASGNKIGTDVRITNDAAGSYYPSLVWTGMEYGVSWSDFRDGDEEIYFARIGASGSKIGNDVRITKAAGLANFPSMVWTGSEYGVSWEDGRDGNREIYFAQIGASGNKIGGDVRITNDVNSSWNPSLAWTGSEYGVSWWDERDGNWQIYFARIDAEGNKISGDVRITNDAANSWSTTPSTSLVWTGSEYGVSWEDGRDGNYEIYFARIIGNFTPTP